MGRSKRPIPKGLADKLSYVRFNLNFTQKQMFERLRSGLDPEVDQIRLHPSHISEYERGIREPPLRILLEYARIAQLPMEVLVDPRLLLPYELSLSLIVDRIRELGPKTFWARARRAQSPGDKITKIQEPDKNRSQRPSKRRKSKT